MERKLINYLPYIVRGYAEFQGISESEQPEFETVWNSSDEVLNNQFIDTATNYGLSKWEKMLNIRPKGTDTLESRRIKIKAKLNTIIPYTFRTLLQKLEAISYNLPFEVTIKENSYLLQIFTEWDIQGQIDSLKSILDEMVPVNISILSQNKISGDCKNTMYLCHGLGFCELIAISDAGNEYVNLRSDLLVPSAPVLCDLLPLDDVGNESYSIQSDLMVPALSVNCDLISLDDAGDEVHSISGTIHVPIGQAFTEKINLHD